MARRLGDWGCKYGKVVRRRESSQCHRRTNNYCIRYLFMLGLIVCLRSALAPLLILRRCHSRLCCFADICRCKIIAGLWCGKGIGKSADWHDDSLDYGAEKGSTRLLCGTAMRGAEGMSDGMAIIDHGAERKTIGHALRNLRHGLRILADCGIVISARNRRRGTCPRSLRLRRLSAFFSAGSSQRRLDSSV